LGNKWWLKFRLAGNIVLPGWLFWAAGCQIDFHQEGYLNLKPPLNALFNSRPD
jgi:hypothetical protein